MAFPTTGILDNFNRANEGPPPSADWTTDPLGFGDSGLKVLTNQCIGNNSGSDNSGYWDTTTFGPDCEVYATIVVRPNTGQYFGVYARLVQIGAGTTDGYYVEYIFQAAGTDTVSIYRIDNASFTVLGSAISQDFNLGDKLGLELIGSTLTAYRHDGSSWASLGSRTDSTHSAAGNIGLAMHDVAIADDFGGGTVVAGGFGSLVDGRLVINGILQGRLVR